MGAAQSAAPIVADVAPGRATGTTVTTLGAVTTIDGGVRSGGNLLHSFDRFSVPAGVTARWTTADPTTISNLMNRVTGGSASQIDGTLDSTSLPNAAFYFINPAGIVFGASASVNVPAAAYFSTADSIRFTRGADFAVTTTDGSSFAVAAPASFGFLGGAGNLRVVGSGGLLANPGKLSLSGADLTIDNATVSTSGVDLFAVGTGPGRLDLADPFTAPRAGTLAITGASSVIAASSPGVLASVRAGAGTLLIDRGQLRATGTAAVAGGPVDVRAGSVTVRNDGLISTSTAGSGNAGLASIDADSILLERGRVESTTLAGSSGNAGTVRLRAGSLTVRLLGSVSTAADPNATGGAGSVQILADTLLVDGSGSSSTTGIETNVQNTSGTSGQISVAGRNSNKAMLVTLLNGGAIEANSISGNAAGSIDVLTQTLRLNGGLSRLQSNNNGLGDAGRINVVANGISFAGLTADGQRTDFSIISTEAQNGRAGAITLASDTIVVNNGLISSRSRGGSGGSGSITVTTAGDTGGSGTSITLTNFGTISTNTAGSGNAGLITLSAPDGVVISNNGLIESQTVEGGAAGTVRLSAGTLTIRNFGKISTTTRGAGDAGQVNVTIAGNAVLDQFGRVESTTYASGNAGKITIKANALSLFTHGSVTTTAEIENGIEATGRAGDVDILTDTLVVDGTQSDPDSPGAGINSNVRGVTGGVGGQIRVLGPDADPTQPATASTARAARVTVQNGGKIETSSNSGNAAGDIVIAARDLRVTQGLTRIQSNNAGTGAGGRITVLADSLTVLDRAAITTNAEFGPAGDLHVSSDQIVLDSGRLASNANGRLRGRSGTVNVAPLTSGGGTLSIINGGAIETVSSSPDPAGMIAIQMRSVTQRGSASASEPSRIDSRNIAGQFTPPGVLSGEQGKAGEIAVVAGTLSLSDGATITTNSADGPAGDILVDADAIDLTAAEISSNSGVRRGRSGSITLAQRTEGSGSIALQNGGQVQTTSANGDQAGIIVLNADDILTAGAGSLVTSDNVSTVGAGGPAGSLFLGANRLRLLDGGKISSDAALGNAGNITVAIPASGTLILDGAVLPGQITTTSPVGGGRIDIAAPLAIISNGGIIRARGTTRGALVTIASRFFIQSTDRSNLLEVDGLLDLNSQVGDVSSGTEVIQVPFIDAAGVLRGQCAAVRESGEASQLGITLSGPHAIAPTAPPAAGAAMCR
jgi:filamentous hemagglutinin family protein